MTTCKQLKQNKIPAIQYKGFTIIFMSGEYQASAYSNPSFYNTNFDKLKKQIYHYLKN